MICGGEREFYWESGKLLAEQNRLRSKEAVSPVQNLSG